MWHHNKPVMHKSHRFCCLSFLRCLSVFSLFGPSVTQPVVTFKELMIWSHPSLSSSCLSLSVSYYYVESAYIFFLDLTDSCQPFIWVALFFSPIDGLFLSLCFVLILVIMVYSSWKTKIQYLKTLGCYMHRSIHHTGMLSFRKVC